MSTENISTVRVLAGGFVEVKHNESGQFGWVLKPMTGHLLHVKLEGVTESGYIFDSYRTAQTAGIDAILSEQPTLRKLVEDQARLLA